MSMYVVTHKNFNYQIPSEYKKIVVNANKNNVQGDLYDNVGDNISLKNESYCELTAYYSIWKNTLDEYVGICHYRRYFAINNRLITDEFIKRTINNNTIILPQKNKFKRRMDFRYWTTSGYKGDLIVIRNAIRKISPEYLDDFDSFMHQYEMYSYNMIIAEREIFNNYCKWLFTVLSEIENNMDVNARKGYYRRLYGFIAERLLNVYFMHNKYKIIECPVLFIGNEESIINRLSNRLNKIKDKYIIGKSGIK